MVRNIVVFGGSSHPQLTESICNHLGIPQANIFLGKFAVGETRVEIKESVRGKDVYVIQSGGGKVNDHYIELLITIAACKTASAKKVTAVLPLFPYSRQPDIPYNKVGAPLVKGTAQSHYNNDYTFDSRPQTPRPDQQQSPGIGPSTEGLHKQLLRLQTHDQPNGSSTFNATEAIHNQTRPSRRSDAGNTDPNARSNAHVSQPETVATAPHVAKVPAFVAQKGYKQWVAQAGTLVADLLTCAGTDHVITLDLHDPQYQGFFDIPVDNLYGRHLLRRYIQYNIPDFRNAVIVSPDAGGAKRATAVADSLGMPFALIHKVCKLPSRAPPVPFLH